MLCIIFVITEEFQYHFIIIWAIATLMQEGIGIMEIMNAIVERIPPPFDTAERPLRALIFDRYLT